MEILWLSANTLKNGISTFPKTYSDQLTSYQFHIHWFWFEIIEFY